MEQGRCGNLLEAKGKGWQRVWLLKDAKQLIGVNTLHPYNHTAFNLVSELVLTSTATCPFFTWFIRGLFRPINHCDDRCQYRQTPPQPSSLTILTPGHRRKLLTWVVGPLPWISTVFKISRHPFGASRSPTIVGCVLFKYFAMWACCLPYICTGTPCSGPDRGCGP